MTAQRDPWRRQAEQVARICGAHLSGLVGVYVHGSAALGGFAPSSDLDVLVVGDGATDWERLGRSLLAGAPGHPLELSVVTPAAAAEPSPPWPFRLHAASPDRVVVDNERGDADLAAHYAVAREAGVAVIGPDPRERIGPVARQVLLASLRDELEWGLAHADQRYAVLNACRAEAYAVDGMLLSKTEGAHRWVARHGPDPLVAQALAAQQRGSDLGPCGPRAQKFVDRARRVLEAPAQPDGHLPPSR